MDLRYVIGLAISKALTITDGEPSQSIANFEQLALGAEAEDQSERGLLG